MLQHVEPVVRGAISSAAVVLPARRRVALERWLRGRAEAGQLARADVVVVSFGNSGRTWLRVLLSRFYQARHGLERLVILDFDNLHRRERAIPRVLFTHDNYARDYTRQADRTALYRDRRLVLLARDPADVAVSGSTSGATACAAPRSGSTATRSASIRPCPSSSPTRGGACRGWCGS